MKVLVVEDDVLIAKIKALYSDLCKKINSITILDDGFGFKNHWWFYRSGTKEVMYEDQISVLIERGWYLWHQHDKA